MIRMGTCVNLCVGTMLCSAEKHGYGASKISSCCAVLVLLILPVSQVIHCVGWGEVFAFHCNTARPDDTPVDGSSCSQ